MSKLTVIQSGEQVGLDPSHSGFAHGFGIFETIRVQDGCLRFWEDHWARLLGSAQRLELPMEVASGEVLEAIRTLFSEGTDKEAVVKLSLLREGTGVRLYVYKRPSFPIPEKVRLLLDASYPLNEHSALAGHKTHNYMENWLLLEEARAAGFFDRIRLNTAGNLAETCIANFFFMVDGQLYTPALATGVLPGVLRAAICECVQVEAGLYSPSVLERAESVFLSNASVGLLPVSSIEWVGGSRKKFGDVPDYILSAKKQVDILAKHRGVQIF